MRDLIPVSPAGQGFQTVIVDMYGGSSDVKNLANKVESIDKRLVAVETKVDSVEKRFSTVESKLPDISEKFGELKNWRQIAFIIIAAVVGWVARSGKM